MARPLEVFPVGSKPLEDLDWTAEQREAAIQHSKSQVNIVVAGVTGSGKSTVINAMCGAVPREGQAARDGEIDLPAKEGHTLDHETQGVECYEAQTTTYETAAVCAAAGDDNRTARIYTIRVWDSPGLEDGTGRGRTYVLQLKEKCGNSIDMLLYCIDISKKRSIVPEMVPGIALVTNILGCDVWKHSMIVLTFANILENNIEEEIDQEAVLHVFLSRVHQWQENVRLALITAGVPDVIVQQIPIEPAGHYTTPHLPDRIHWLGYLWLLFISHTRDEAKLAIFVNNQHRIKNAEYLTPVDFEYLLEHCRTPPIIIDHSNAIKIGTTISVGVASVAGACAGGVTGGLLLGALTAGLGTGVGLAAGATVGAVAGPLCGVAISKLLQKKRAKVAKHNDKP